MENVSIWAHQEIDYIEDVDQGKLLSDEERMTFMPGWNVPKAFRWQNGFRITIKGIYET